MSSKSVVVHYNSTLEISILGTFMRWPTTWHDVSHLLTKDVFYVEAHKDVFEFFERQIKESGTISYAGIERIKILNNPIAWAAEAMDSVYSSVPLKSDVNELLQYYYARQGTRIARDIAAKIDDGEDPRTAILSGSDELNRVIEKDNNETVGDEKTAYKDLQELLNTSAPIQTGIRGLPVKRGQLIIVAARPGVGKSSLALQIAAYISRTLGRVRYFSLEMPRRDMWARIITQQTQTTKPYEPKLLSNWILSNKECIDVLPITFDDRDRIPVEDIVAKAKAQHQREPLSAIVVDYIQRVTLRSKKKTDTRNNEVGEVASALKCLARELNVPVIVPAQLNRDIEKDEGRKPRLSDLRESGNIEQDADQVWFIYRPKNSFDEGSDQFNCREVKILKEKDRDGVQGEEFNLSWFPEILTFRPNT